MQVAGWLQLLNYQLFRKEPAFTPRIISRFFTNAAFDSGKAEKTTGVPHHPFSGRVAKNHLFIKK